MASALVGTGQCSLSHERMMFVDSCGLGVARMLEAPPPGRGVPLPAFLPALDPAGRLLCRGMVGLAPPVSSWTRCSRVGLTRLGGGGAFLPGDAPLPSAMALAAAGPSAAGLGALAPAGLCAYAGPRPSLLSAASTRARKSNSAPSPTESRFDAGGIQWLDTPAEAADEHTHGESRHRPMTT